MKHEEKVATVEKRMYFKPAQACSMDMFTIQHELNGVDRKLCVCVCVTCVFCICACMAAPHVILQANFAILLSLTCHFHYTTKFRHCVIASAISSVCVRLSESVRVNLQGQ